MKTSRKIQKKYTEGFALFIAVLVSSIVLTIGLTIINIAYKQLVFSNLGKESELAFSAADAAMECALYRDYSSGGGAFDFGVTPASSNISCFSANPNNIPVTTTMSGGGTVQTSHFQIDWGTTPMCVDGTVVKYHTDSDVLGVPIPGESANCPLGTTCTRTTAKGYNITCAQLVTPPTRTVERALKASY